MWKQRTHYKYKVGVSVLLRLFISSKEVGNTAYDLYHIHEQNFIFKKKKKKKKKKKYGPNKSKGDENINCTVVSSEKKSNLKRKKFLPKGSCSFLDRREINSFDRVVSREKVSIPLRNEVLSFMTQDGKFALITEPQRQKETFGRASSGVLRKRLYNFDPLKPHFYKLGFTGVYIIFLILLKNIHCSNEYPQSMF